MTAATSRAVDRVLSRLPNHKRSGNGWSARCPSHDDRAASLSISEGADGRALIYCHAGCTKDAILGELRLTDKELFDERYSGARNGSGNGHHSTKSAKPPATKKDKPPPVYLFADDAVKAAHRILKFNNQGIGEPGPVWWYQLADGENVRATVRWNLPNGKDIRPVSLSRDGKNHWTVTDWDDGRPLLNLPSLLGRESIVFVTEGEPACDAATRIGLLATSPAGGAKAPDKTDWRPLAGRNVVILRDNDGPGLAFANHVAAILTELGCTVRIVLLPSIDAGDDIADWVKRREAEGATAEIMVKEIAEMVAATAVWTSPAPDANEGKSESFSQNGNPAALGKTSKICLAPGTRVYAGDRGNIGEVISDDGGAEVFCRFTSREGNVAEKNIPRGEIRTLDSSPTGAEGTPILPVSARELSVSHPQMRIPVIDGLARRGEIVNIVAASKTGKSWLTYSLIFSIITGGRWLDTFQTLPGKVLLIDNELHPETINFRLERVAISLSLGESWVDMVDVISLRGKFIDFVSIEPTIKALERNKYCCIIADAMYRFWPAGLNENANADITNVYNRLDGFSEYANAVWVNIHHASKGDQSGKSVVDIGAGAGAQSRATDCHLILRPHEEDGVSVLEAKVRSFPPVEPLSLRWDYPLWRRDDAADPSQIKRPDANQTKWAANDEAGRKKIFAALVGGNETTVNGVRKLLACRKERAEKLIYQMLNLGEIVETEGDVNGNSTEVYRLAEPQ